MTDLLAVENLSSGYSGSVVVKNVDLKIAAGEAVALVGPNGAGKSTFLKTVSGMLPVKGGTFRFRREDSTGWSTAKLVSEGLVHVPEGRQVFPKLSVRENLWLGGYAAPEAREARQEMVLEIFPRLRERLSQAADTMSGGEQQMLAIGRGLMANAKLLMVDEPALGLAPVMVDKLAEAFTLARTKFDVSLLIVEQSTVLAREICDTAHIMVGGRIVMKVQADLLEQHELMELYAGRHSVGEII